MKALKKVLYFESGAYGGGSFESLYLTVKNVDRDRYSPCVLFFNKNVYTDKLKALDVPFIIAHDPIYSKNTNPLTRRFLAKNAILMGRFLPHLSIRYEYLVHVKTIKRTKELVRDYGIDILHLNDQINMNFFATFIPTESKIPCISHLRSPDTLGFNICKANEANKAISEFIAVEYETRDVWVEEGIDPSKVRVVPNGIEDIDVSPLDVRRTFGIDRSRRHVIGCVGRIIKERGYDFMLKAFSRVLKEMPECVLIIVGGWEEKVKKDLDRIIKEKGLEGKVIFAGYVEEAKRIIKGLDILVLPYNQMPFGRVLMEAWQLRVPVITTKVGSIVKYVQHGENVFLVPYGDEKEMSRTIVKVLEDPSLGKKLAESGYRVCRKNYSISGYISEIQGAYDRLLRR